MRWILQALVGGQFSCRWVWQHSSGQILTSTHHATTFLSWLLCRVMASLPTLLLIEHDLGQDDLSIDLRSMVDKVVMAVVEHQRVKTVLVVLVVAWGWHILHALPVIWAKRMRGWRWYASCFKLCDRVWSASCHGELPLVEPGSFLLDWLVATGGQVHWLLVTNLQSAYAAINNCLLNLILYLRKVIVLSRHQPPVILQQIIIASICTRCGRHSPAPTATLIMIIIVLMMMVTDAGRWRGGDGGLEVELLSSLFNRDGYIHRHFIIVRIVAAGLMLVKLAAEPCACLLFWTCPFCRCIECVINVHDLLVVIRASRYCTTRSHRSINVELLDWLWWLLSELDTA